MEILVIVILSVAVLFLFAKLIIIKKQIRSVSKQLNDKDNKLISVMLMDKDLEEAACKINSMIDNISEIKTDSEKKSDTLKENITDITHDIRTPLTSVIGYLQMALKEKHSEEQANDIRIALERATYCSKMVDDFFELTVLDSKGIEVNFAKVDVNDLLCELILANYPGFSSHNITPHFNDSNIPVYINADPKLITRVFQNIISNSIKYAVDDVYFDIIVGEQVVIEISNPTNEKNIETDKLFEKFFRAEKSRSSKGTGIGLYICKLFTESMNGNISASFNDGKLTVKLCFDKYDLSDFIE